MDVTRSLMCQLEQTLWLPSMSVQPAITDLLRATYTADGTDAQLVAEYDRRRSLDLDVDGDWVCAEPLAQAAPQLGAVLEEVGRARHRG